MGYDADGTLTIDGRSYRGTARLEHKDLTFRGETRFTIPLNQIVEVHVREDSLLVRFGERQAVLTIGSGAEKWADRIANPRSRVDKLGAKEGMRISLVNVEDPSLEQELESRGVAIESPRAIGLDIIFFGVKSAHDLLRLRTLSSRLRPDGAIWVIRAKGKRAPVSESESMTAGKRAGLVDVKVVSFSDTHSAEKYVIPVTKRSRPGRSAAPSTRKRRSPSSPGRT